MIKVRILIAVKVCMTEIWFWGQESWTLKGVFKKSAEKLVWTALKSDFCSKLEVQRAQS